jgi:hypothetical protein
MDTAIVPALAALTGSAIGGLTSLCASWFTQMAQFRAQERFSGHISPPLDWNAIVDNDGAQGAISLRNPTCKSEGVV